MSGGAAGGAERAFTQSIAVRAHWDVKAAQIRDSVKFAVCSDGGSNSQDQNLGNMAYPDICCTECGGINWSSWGWPEVSDPIRGITDCPNGSYCAECWGGKADLGWYKDPDRQKASTRHLGGVNIGFADGHAAWMPSQRVLTLFDEGNLQGVSIWCGGATRAAYEANCGAPPAGAEFLF